MASIEVLQALNSAIWLARNAEHISKTETLTVIEQIGQYKVFSARQLSAMTKGRISHQSAAKVCNKTDRSGGSLSIESLEDIKECFHAHINGSVNYQIVSRIIKAGTSQRMLSKLTGISQTSISKGVSK